MREIVWNSTMRMTVNEWHAQSVLKLTEKKNSNLTHNCDKANQLEQDKTIRMTVNEWHAHSVLKLRGKKEFKT